MEINDERNVLHVGSPRSGRDLVITPSMAEAVIGRIRDAGGTLRVWAVLHEDNYETIFGDGFYLHVRGIALNRDDAKKLAALANDPQWADYTRCAKWHIKEYQLGLVNSLPALLQEWPTSEEFKIEHLVEILAEIPNGDTASKLHIGWDGRRNSPLLTLPGTSSAE
jgi:hypothetical protein